MKNQYQDHLEYCRVVLNQIYKRNNIYMHYNIGLKNGFPVYVTEVRMYASLDKYWYGLQAEYGQILFDNYKPFHRLSKYPDYR